MLAIRLSAIRGFLKLSSVFSSWSVFIGTSPSFDRAASWLVRVYVLTATPGCSVCWFTDFFFFLAEGLCSAMLHCSAYKGKHFHCKSKLISVVEPVQFCQGHRAGRHVHATSRHVTFIYIQVSPDKKKLIIQKLRFTQMRNQHVVFVTL